MSVGDQVNVYRRALLALMALGPNASELAMPYMVALQELWSAFGVPRDGPARADALRHREWHMTVGRRLQRSLRAEAKRRGWVGDELLGGTTLKDRFQLSATSRTNHHGEIEWCIQDVNWSVLMVELEYVGEEPR